MKVVVHDTSILLDLLTSQTVDLWFGSDIETWTTNLIFTPDLLLSEDFKLIKAYADAKKFRIKKITGSMMSKIVEARKQTSLGLSFADISSLDLSKELGKKTFLATGDRLVRKLAEVKGIKACGILGLFDLMVGVVAECPAMLPKSVAIEKLRLLMAAPGCRLPLEKCQKRISEWTE